MLAMCDILQATKNTNMYPPNILQTSQADLMRTLVDVMNIQKNVYEEVLRNSSRFDNLERKLDKVIGGDRIDTEPTQLIDKSKSMNMEEEKDDHKSSLKMPMSNYSFGSMSKSNFHFEKIISSDHSKLLQLEKPLNLSMPKKLSKNIRSGRLDFKEKTALFPNKKDVII